ncbi:MAG: polyprenyl diphosphate synthase [Phycisphaerales bacterium]|nr:polyprenyl diphosphate synthase [Phycisphaerales bacterium]
MPESVRGRAAGITAEDQASHLRAWGIDPRRVPRHIAIIMDGNGRWARAQGFERTHGHLAGAEAVRRTVEECGRLGVDFLTLYSFSSENWKRPIEEVDALMALCLRYCASERDELASRNVRVRVIGDRDGLRPDVRAALADLEAATSACTGPTLCLAINYGSRAEMLRAVRNLAERAARGEIAPGEIDEARFAAELDTGGIPDPDLLVRTAGEMRLSNFLLWQISYAELYVTDTLWPEFGEEALREAIRAYAARERRFGGLADGGQAGDKRGAGGRGGGGAC